MKKVLLVAPLLVDKPDSLPMPVNLLYLATALKTFEPSFKVRILDLNLEYFRRGAPKADLLNLQKKVVSEHITRHGRYDLVGLTGLNDNFFYTVLLAGYIKKRFNPTIVTGGPHATFIARELLEEYDFIDYIVRFEGSYPFVRLLRTISDGSYSDLANIPNLAYRDRETDKIFETWSENHHYIMDKDFFFDYSLLPTEKYMQINPDFHFPILAGSGCPYSCTFCSTTLMWKRRYLVRAPEVIAKEIRDTSKRYGYKKVSFIHDNLLFDRDYVIKLCNELKKLNIGWSCSGRLDNTYAIRDLLPLLKASGCEGIFIGIESGSKRIQKTIRKRIDPERSFEMLRLMQKSEIEPVFSFMIGFPEETERDLDQTIRMTFRLKTLGARRVNIHNLIPNPGTDIYKNYRRFKKSNTYNDSNYYNTLFYKNETVRRIIDSSPKIFGSHRLVRMSALKRDYNSYNIARALDELLVDYPKSFDFLFHTLGINPASLFELLEKEKPLGLITRQMEKRLGRLKYNIFAEMLRYEAKINKIVAMKEDAGFDRLRNRAGAKDSIVKDAVRLKLRLRRNIDIMDSGFGIEYYITPSGYKKRVKERRPSHLLLASAGDRVDSFTINEQLCKMLRFIRRNTGVKVSELLNRFGSGKKTINIICQLIENDIAKLYGVDPI